MFRSKDGLFSYLANFRRRCFHPNPFSQHLSLIIKHKNKQSWKKNILFGVGTGCFPIPWLRAIKGWAQGQVQGTVILIFILLACMCIRNHHHYHQDHYPDDQCVLLWASRGDEHWVKSWEDNCTVWQSFCCHLSQSNLETWSFSHSCNLPSVAMSFWFENECFHYYYYYYF